MFKKPSNEEIFLFIHFSHEAERIECPYHEIVATYHGKNVPLPHPWAQGHLNAIHYLFNIIDKIDFPVKSNAPITNHFQSDSQLFWLKQLNYIIHDPVLKFPGNEDNHNLPKRFQLANWRTEPAQNTFSLAPDPALIPKILHNWITKVATMHSKVKDKVHNPHGLTRELAYEMDNLTYHTNLMLCTTQPFSHGNNRLARLVDNALRLQWRLPWRPFDKSHLYDKFKEDLTEFQKSQLPAVIKDALNTPGF